MKKKTVKVVKKGWAIVQADLEDTWDNVIYSSRNQALKQMRLEQSRTVSGFKFLRVIPCTVIYEI